MKSHFCVYLEAFLCLSKERARELKKNEDLAETVILTLVWFYYLRCSWFGLTNV